MNALIFFYSRTGVTANVASTLGEKLDVTCVQLEDRQNRAGVLGWLRGGRDAFFKRVTEVDADVDNLAAQDLVIVGTPVWANTMTPAVRTFLTKYNSDIKRLAVFCTTASSGMENTLQEMQELASAPCIAAQGFFEKDVRANAIDTALHAFIQTIRENMDV